MCRLAYIPASAPVLLRDLETLFEHLEYACGGDGNGIAIVGGSAPVIVKGVKTETGELAKLTMKAVKSGKSVFFHTRKISVGWSHDAQCHPFGFSGKGGAGVLCHNGTWYQGSAIAAYLGCGSDTAALAKVLGKFGQEGAKARGLWPTSGVFLIHDARTGDNRGVRESGDLVYCESTGVYASELPRDWCGVSSYHVASGHNNLDKPAKRLPIVTKVATWKPAAPSNGGWQRDDRDLWQQTSDGRWKLYGMREGD